MRDCVKVAYVYSIGLCAGLEKITIFSEKIENIDLIDKVHQINDLIHEQLQATLR